jgi:SAM-dependent methyltransferase
MPSCGRPECPPHRYQRRRRLGRWHRVALPDNRFSAATCFALLHHMPSEAAQDQLFGELHRVLRSGGSFVATDSLDTDRIRQAHVDDTYVPLDPAHWNPDFESPALLTSLSYRAERIESEEIRSGSPHSSRSYLLRPSTIRRPLGYLAFNCGGGRYSPLDRQGCATEVPFAGNSREHSAHKPRPHDEACARVVIRKLSALWQDPTSPCHLRSRRPRPPTSLVG